MDIKKSVYNKLDGRIFGLIHDFTDGEPRVNYDKIVIQLNSMYGKSRICDMITLCQFYPRIYNGDIIRGLFLFRTSRKLCEKCHNNNVSFSHYLVCYDCATEENPEEFAYYHQRCSPPSIRLR